MPLQRPVANSDLFPHRPEYTSQELDCRHTSVLATVTEEPNATDTVPAGLHVLSDPTAQPLPVLPVILQQLVLNRLVPSIMPGRRVFEQLPDIV